jgi:hypothetical protein
MMLNTRENFKTDKQYERWLEYYEFFSKLIEIQKTKTIWAYFDYAKQFEALDKFQFVEYINHSNIIEWHINEVSPKGCATGWVGSCHDLNKKTGEYDLIYIEEPLTKLIKRLKFKTYDNEVFITKD